MAVYKITAMYYRVCMAPDGDRTEKAINLMPTGYYKRLPFLAKQMNI